MEILAELLSQPAFDAKLLRGEVGVVEEEIQSYEDNPEELIHDLAAEVLWGDHPLGSPILGRRETLRRLRQRGVRRFYQSHYGGENVIIASPVRGRRNALRTSS